MVPAPSTTRKLAFSAVTLLLFLGGLELLLRVTTSGMGRASIPEDDVLAHVSAEEIEYDPLYGWRRSVVPDLANGIESHGFRRATELPQPKPTGGWRAFTFGDSQTYGAGLQVDQTYSHVAEQALRQRHPDRSVEVVNTGLSGYGSLQALRLIQHQVLDLEPDLLIVDCRTHDQPRDELVAQAPALPGLDRLLFHWRTWYVLRFTVDRALGRTAPMNPSPPPDPSLAAAGNHDLIMAQAAEADVPVVFLDYPFWNAQQRPDQQAQGARFEEIACLATETYLPPGAVVIPVCDALRRSGMPASELFLDNNHLSAAGARVVGQALAQGIEALGLGPEAATR